MRCYRCGGNAKEKSVTFSLETNRGLVMVHGVPAKVCTRCGEQSFSIDVAKQLEAKRDRINKGFEHPPMSNVREATLV